MPFLLRTSDDHTPFAWYEWVFAPLLWVGVPLLLLVLCVVAPPFMLLYPEHVRRVHEDGPPREQELMRRYRRYASRVSFWRRLWRVLTFWCWRYTAAGRARARRRERYRTRHEPDG